MSRIKIPTAVAAFALAGTCLAAGPAGAEPDRATGVAPHTIVRGLTSPLSVAVAGDGTRYFSQSFAGLLQRQKPGKPAQVIYEKPNGWEAGAVSERNGKVRFAISKGQTALLLGFTRGRLHRVADLGGFERSSNPDAKVIYGFRNLAADCAAQLPDGMPASYPGIVDSHPYASTQAPSGITFVADAAGNDIVAVWPTGKVKRIAVLPPVARKVNAQFAEQGHLPACTIGQTYWFEAVPTDVEIGPGGQLYVSTLPGGPEDGSLGAAASIYRVNPSTGKVAKIAGGLVSATGLAVTPRGDVLVAELFAGRISRILAGSHTARTWSPASMPGDIEWAPSGIYGTTDVLTGMSGQPGDVPNGKLVRFRRSDG